MNSKKYINNHDFGYGKIREKDEVNKLRLRNLEDFIEYLKGVLDNAFDCVIFGNNCLFFNNGRIIKLEIEKI